MRLDDLIVLFVGCPIAILSLLYAIFAKDLRGPYARRHTSHLILPPPAFKPFVEVKGLDQKGGPVN